MAVALISSSTLLPVAKASPVPQQAIFNNNRHAQAAMNGGPATILDILGERPEFSQLLELIQKDADLTKLLADAGTQPTLFAPTNDAFDSVSDIDYPTSEVLMYHISSQAYNSTSLTGESLIKSLYDSPGLNNSPQFLRISLEMPNIPSTTLSMRQSLWGTEPEIWIPELEMDAETEEDADVTGLYVNRAKVIQPDLVAQSGGIVHGVNRIIRPPGKTILDEVLRRGMHFTYLTNAWAETGVDAHVRDGKGLTVFAPSDKAWNALPKKLRKYLFSNKGREHLKILTMYHVGNRAVYTYDIFNKTQDDGTPGDSYHEVVLQTLLNSPKYVLKIQGKAKKEFNWNSNDVDENEYEFENDDEYDVDDDEYEDQEDEMPLPRIKSRGPTDIIGWRDIRVVDDPPTPVPTEPVPSPTGGFPQPGPTPTRRPGHPGEHPDYPGHHPDKPDEPDHHYPHKDPNHRHHHKHRNGKHHKHRHHRHHDHVPHRGGVPNKHAIRRDPIFVNGKAQIVHGHENWIAGNGVVHVTDKVLMPPRSKGCHQMTSGECSVWTTLWELAQEDLENTMEDVVEWLDGLSLFGEKQEEQEEEEEEEREEEREEQDAEREEEEMYFAF
ncbi:hypothetical protein BGZ94_007380 [Podila epigama]|nr:hypothetical protein BGZ94_007380 [Podila epigama]